MSLTIQKLNDDTTFLLTLPANPPYHILLDPWLTGSSTLLHPSFQTARHTLPSVVPTILSLPKHPDLILISQSQPDHCHRETLCALPSRPQHTRILAVPAAAKKIKRWGHFEEGVVGVLHRFDEKKREIARIAIPLLLPPDVEEDDGFHRPCIYASPLRSTPALRHDSKFDDTDLDVLSILYAPHGIGLPSLQTYLDNHLWPTGTSRLTLLLHSLHRATNPRLLGGVCAAGAPGGIPLARALRAKYWVPAHDGGKDMSGLAVRWLRRRQWDLEEVEGEVRDSGTRVKALQIGEMWKMGDFGG
ncbi:MAG: hypothetical protein FE78DRAFT_146642 [Acidomyces sp. 'richmondensis']|nr:MAG: hypothetical protein FE78DRAFT_146642 [Acidomyces sp. 'richmondensis']